MKKIEVNRGEVQITRGKLSKGPPQKKKMDVVMCERLERIGSWE